MRGRNPTRRTLIATALAAAGGFAVGVGVERVAAQQRTTRSKRWPSPPLPTSRHELGAWIVVTSDNTVIVRVARAEMGQGILTGLAQLAAEELDCDWAQVRAELVKPGENQARGRLWGDFATSNSRTVRTLQGPMREAGAAARMMLIDAAALAWNVPKAEIITTRGELRHSPTGRWATYGSMADAASKITPPSRAALQLTPEASWSIAGTSTPSLLARDIVAGRAIYGIDVQLPGMLRAAITSHPVPGGRLGSFDEARALTMPGVRRVLAVGDDAVAVVADSWWQASRALAEVVITWDVAAGNGISSESIGAYLKTGLETTDAFVGRTHGDALAALRSASQTVEAVYSTPFLHHATLEPMNATALWTPDRLDVWAPTQNGDATLRVAAEAGGHPIEAVEVHRTLMGGSYGRRLRQDAARQVVLIAREMPGIPVQLLWSREEDTTHGHYRPVTQARIRGGLDDKGDATGLILRISGQSILTSNLPRAATGPAGRDPRMFQGLLAQPGEAQMGYSIPSIYIDHAMRYTHMPVGSWRGVHTTQNGVYLECFIDELAAAAKRDPLEFRRNLMRGHPKHLAVLLAATNAAGWAEPPAPGISRGLAQMMAVGSYAAVVAEVAVSPEEAVRVVRVVVALDCGQVVNPRLVQGQIEGSVAMAVSATLGEAITIREGRVVERNFDTYRVLRLAEMPIVQSVLVPSGDFWGGVGEAVIGAVAPAVVNAASAALRRRIRSLPLRQSS